MKKEGKLKFIFTILLVVLICIISLGGIYIKDKNIRKNILPDYKFGMDLGTNLIVKLDVPPVKNDANSENNNDTENNQENTESIDTENKEGQAVETVNTEENYKKSKKIMEERLKLAKVNQYTIRLDEKSGTMVIEIAEDLEPVTLQTLFMKGKTEILFGDSKEVIGDYKSFKNIDAQIENANGIYYVKFDLEFTKDAVAKFKEVQNRINNSENVEDADKNISISIDGNDIYSRSATEFLTYATKGMLSLQSNSVSQKMSDLNEVLNQFNAEKILMEVEPLPIEYEITYSNDLHSNINKYGIISVFAAICVVMFVYLIIKSKLNGIYAWINILGFVSTLLLVVRFVKIEISISTIVAIALISILQFIYTLKMLNAKLNSKSFVEKTLEFTKILIPALIVSIVIAFAKILEISGFGLIVFWGIILFVIYNYIITRAIFTNFKSTK